MYKPKYKYTKYQILKVLAWLCADYHSGQWSTGYRYLSIALHRLHDMGDDYPLSRPLSKAEKSLYRYLRDTYKDKL